MATLTVFVVALLVAGCGGNEENTDTTAPAPAKEAPAPEAGSGNGAQVSDQGFAQIRKGQTMDEVRSILGEAESSETDLDRQRTCWYWNLDEKKYTVVCFDQEGRVMQMDQTTR